LKPQGARVYLGAIHNMERFQARIAVARKYLPEFGLGAYCGFGLAGIPTAQNPGRSLNGRRSRHGISSAANARAPC
jgi:hypothetical protein